MIQDQHNEIHTSFGHNITMLKHIFKDNNLYSHLVGNISRAGLNYIFHETKRAENVDSDSSKCGCKLMKIYDCSRACLIYKKVKLHSPIRMDEVCTHWKRLRFDDDGVMKYDKSNISILTEWEVIQKRILKADDNMKFHIKEQLRKTTYLKILDLKPPSQLIKIKHASKMVTPTLSDNSTIRSPSYFEHVDKYFPDSLTLKSKKVFLNDLVLTNNTTRKITYNDNYETHIMTISPPLLDSA